MLDYSSDDDIKVLAEQSKVKCFTFKILTVLFYTSLLDYGSSSTVAVSSCKSLLEIHPNATSGNYWIRLGNGSTQTPPFQVYCDMTTDGGGWTLVCSYRFLNFANFKNTSNAISPIPNWPIDSNTSGLTVRSSTVPLYETSYSAMEFALWKEIGTEFLVKPNITHWISCQPGTGDLVNWKAGTLDCKVVKSIATVCFDYAPTELKLQMCGPALLRNGKKYIYFEGGTTKCWPIHDPCGTKSLVNHLTSISPPGGALYIR